MNCVPMLDMTPRQTNRAHRPPNASSTVVPNIRVGCLGWGTLGGCPCPPPPPPPPDETRDWAQRLELVARRIGSRFARSETRDRADAYLRGLLAPVQRKNAWHLAERVGEAAPDGVQHLPGRAGWSPDAARGDPRGYVVETVGHPDAVVILDEAGLLKKGTHSAGVARQSTSTAGRAEDAQVGVSWPMPHPTGRPSSRKPRRWLEEGKRPDVLGVRGNQHVTIGVRRVEVADLARSLVKRSWPEVTIGAGGGCPSALRRRTWQRRSVKASGDRRPALRAERSSAERARTKSGGLMTGQDRSATLNCTRGSLRSH
jgi:hypothetical protein